MEKEVVSSGRGDLERSSRQWLALDIRQIRRD
jgi:hypothetical protein